MPFDSSPDPASDSADSLNPRSSATRSAPYVSINATLVEAARLGLTDFVESMLEMGADANFSDAFGLTPLRLAANAGDTRMIRLLLRHGAKINANAGIDSSGSAGLSAMCAAGLNNRLDAVALLASYAMDLEQTQELISCAGSCCTLLEMTLVAGKMEIAAWLIDHGADVECIENNDESLLERMLSGKNYPAVLLLAASAARISSQVVMVLEKKENSHFLKAVQEIHRFSGRKKWPRKTDENSLVTTKQDFELTEESDLEFSGESAKKYRHEIYGSSKRDIRSRSKDFVSSGIYSVKAQLASSSLNIRKLLPTQASRILRNNDMFARLVEQGELVRARDFVSAHELDMEMVRCEKNGMTALQLLCMAAAKTCKPAAGIEFDGHFLVSELVIFELACAIERNMDQDTGMRAHINARFESTGNTVLHEFIALGQSRLVMHLLGLKIFKNLVNTSNNDLRRPLHLAVHRQDPHLMSSLVRAGANLNAFDRQGHTPLHVAAFMLEHPCAEIAVTMGANISLSTRTGTSLEQIIDQRKGQSEILQGMIQARQAIDSAKSIFSANNPMALAVRSKTLNNPKKK